jgi:hypothetical protein
MGSIATSQCLAADSFNTAGIGYLNRTIHLGAYNASLDQLELLEDQSVIAEVVR